MSEKLPFIEGTRIGNIFVNPGTGPVEDATEEQARKNMQPFIRELGINHGAVRLRRHRRADYGAGRFCFSIHYEGRRCEVQMPGLPLDAVRFTGESQDPWQYPRLYVDDSSWLWKYAVNSARRRLTEDEEK